MALQWRNFMTQNIPSWPKMSLHDPKWPLNILQGHNTWLYAILGYPGPFSEANVAPVGHWKGSRVVQYDTISCSIPMGSVLGCFGVFWVHAGPFGVMNGHFWSWRAIFGAILGHYGAPVGPWKGPRVVQHDILSCYIATWSDLGSFGVMQCHFEPFWWFWAIQAFLVLFWAILGPPWVPEWPQGGPTWHIFM